MVHRTSVTCVLPSHYLPYIRTHMHILVHSNMTSNEARFLKKEHFSCSFLQIHCPVTKRYERLCQRSKTSSRQRRTLFDHHETIIRSDPVFIRPLFGRIRPTTRPDFGQSPTGVPPLPAQRLVLPRSTSAEGTRNTPASSRSPAIRENSRRAALAARIGRETRIDVRVGSLTRATMSSSNPISR